MKLKLNDVLIHDAEISIFRLKENKIRAMKWALTIAIILLFIPTIDMSVSILFSLYPLIYLWCIDGQAEEQEKIITRLRDEYKKVYFSCIDLESYKKENSLEIIYLFKTGSRSLNVSTGIIDDEENSYSYIYNTDFLDGEEVPKVRVIEAMRENYELSDYVVFVDGETNKILAFKDELPENKAKEN